MEVAFDCALNYARNHINGKDYSRECDYAKCDYSCEGIMMEDVINGIPEEKLDNSTYQLYYISPKTSEIRKKIEKLLRQNINMDVADIIKNLEDHGYSDWQVITALLNLLNTQEETDVTLDRFLDVYSQSTVKKIVNIVTSMFATDFYVSLQDLKTSMNYTEFEILSAMSLLITENIPVINKYGFSCYVREENNIYFLVDNLSSSTNFFSGYYTQYPVATSYKSFEDIVTQNIYPKTMVTLISDLFECKDEKSFSSKIRILPVYIQQIIIEATIVADEQDLKMNKQTRKYILDYFKGYIKKVDDTWVITLQEKEGIIRCKKVNEDFSEWTNCDKSILTSLKLYEEKKKEKMKRENPYGLVGKYNPENGKFCILDFLKEEESNRKIQGKKKIRKVDTRASNTGTVCSEGGWKLPELLNIVINRLKIPPSDKFMVNKTKEEMIKIALTNDRADKIRQVFSEDEIKSMKTKKLRRALYWGLPPNMGGKRTTKTICENIKTFLEEEGFLEIDVQCGVQGKNKTGVVGVKKAQQSYRFKMVIPADNANKAGQTETENKEIKAMFNHCYKTDKMENYNGNVWIIAYLRKTVAFIIIQNDIIVKACVAANYRRQKIPKDVMRELTKQAKVSILEVPNYVSNYAALIRTYKGYGFTKVIKNDGKVTLLEYTED